MGGRFFYVNVSLFGAAILAKQGRMVGFEVSGFIAVCQFLLFLDDNSMIW